MGRSKAAPVQRPAVQQEPSEDAWLGRRTSRSSPDELLQRELLEEDQQQQVQRQLFEADDTSEEEDAPESDSDDSQDIIVPPTAARKPRRSPLRKKTTRRAMKRVTFSERLATDVLMPEVVLSMGDEADPTLSILEYHPRVNVPDDTSCDATLARYLVRILDLPNIRVVCGSNEDTKQPSTVPITTSLGLSDIWKHYSLPGIHDLETLLDCVRQAFISVEIRPTKDQTAALHIYLTRSALDACNALTLPATLNNNPQSKHWQRADQFRVVLASLFTDISRRSPPCTSPNVTARQIYKIVDNVQLQGWLDTKKPSQSPREFSGLVPTLRPYQEAAVEWMLEREQAPVESREWELSWVVLGDCDRGEITFLPDSTRAPGDQSNVLYNPYWMARH